MTSAAVLFGGPSSERRVSVASAQNVCSVMPAWSAWFVAPEGQVHEISTRELCAFERPFERDFATGEPARHPSVEAFLDALAGDAGAARSTTLFLGCMHGNFGENGALQGLLEARGLAFTGSGAHASAQAFDKVTAKTVVAAAGGVIAEGRVLPTRAPDAARALLLDMFERHGRIVVKPVADGSSVGLVHVRSAGDVERASRQLADSPGVAYLAEVFAVGRELTVGVIENVDGTLRALPPSEVLLDAGHDFDFTGKYLGVGTREITPAVAEVAVIEAAQALALSAHRALGCAGYSRSDLIVTERGPVFLETNTLPGLTGASFLPQQLAVLGIGLPEFFASQLTLALKRAGHA